MVVRNRVQVLPPGLVLPYDSRPDLAFVGQPAWSVIQANATYRYVVPGDVVAVPTSISVLYIASGAVGTRTLRLLITDSNNHVVWAVAAPFQPAASESIRMTWSSLISASSNVPGAAPNPNHSLAPLPPVALLPGWTVEVGVIVFSDPGDLMQAPVAQTVFVPTGPLDDGTIAVPTPLAL